MLTHEFTDYTSHCIGVAWGVYDQSIISAHEDGLVIEWDLESGKKKFEEKIHDG